jgi:putative membrane protein
MQPQTFYRAVADDFSAVDEIIKKQLTSRVPLVSKIGDYITSAGGKRLRPLLVLLCGILTSILTLARLITYLLEYHPIPVWSFFFGLILVSTYMVGREIIRWNWSRAVSFLLGLAFAYWITVAAPMQWGSDLPTLFLAGAIAICAMILPGISGSFILLLLGLYSVVLGAVKDLDMLVLAVFASGCLVGILSFARLAIVA